jgi:hypothetical protein
MDKLTATAYAIATLGGSLLWLLGMMLGGRQEAWDSPLYWTVCYPLALVLAAVIGWKVPERAWRWALAIMLAQAVMLAAAAGDFSLLPLGLMLFAVLALPLIGVATVAASLRRRRRARQA